jgi:hypothetical protein
MTRLELNDSVLDIVTKLSEGNPGVTDVCKELHSQEAEIAKDSAIQGLGSLLLSLDTYAIYGEDIWMLYKDVCGEDIEKTIAVLRSCQLGLTSSIDLKHAIAHYDDGLELDKIVEQVKERLPNFGLNRGGL